MDNQQLLTKKEVLQLFKISSATLDNWIRTSIPDAFENSFYHLHKIERFIKNNDKLTKRANKKQSQKIEIPQDLLLYLKDTSWVTSYLQICEKYSKEHVTSLLITAYKYQLFGTGQANELNAIFPVNEFYSYSVAYQILLNAGDKSATGAYYTPINIVQGMIKNVLKENQSFLEPCCGVGFFVTEYIFAYFKEFKKYPTYPIYLNDIDNNSIEISILNLQRIEKENNIKIPYQSFNQDGLKLELTDVDLIITNPPYGIKNHFPEFNNTEIFTQFIYKGLSSYLKEDGILSYVLPSSLLNIDKYLNIRKFILDNYTLQSIGLFGQSFDKVFSDIITINILKASPQLSNKICYYNEFYYKGSLKQQFIIKDYNLSYLNEADIQIIENLYNIPHTTLEKCIFGLGIVTGNNSKFLSSTPKDNYKPIITGKEIYPGKVIYEQQKYILDNPNEYQQCPPIQLFSFKKIFYRFISNKLICAVDEKNILSINSANFFILQDFPYSEEYVCALLNSDIMNKLYQLQNGSPLKVLKNKIQKLPIFHLSPTDISTIEQCYISNEQTIIESTLEKYLKCK